MKGRDVMRKSRWSTYFQRRNFVHRMVAILILSALLCSSITLSFASDTPAASEQKGVASEAEGGEAQEDTTGWDETEVQAVESESPAADPAQQDSVGAETEAVDFSDEENADNSAGESSDDDSVVPDSGEETAEVSDNSEEQKSEMVGQYENYTVSVAYGEDAGIPSDAELVVKALAEDTPQYESAYAKTENWLKEEYSPEDLISAQKEPNEALVPAEGAEEVPEIAKMILLDIGIEKDGEKIEPQSEVSVSIEFNETELIGEDQIVLLHIVDDVLVLPNDQEAGVSAEGDVTASFVTDSFSEYPLVALKAPVLRASPHPEEITTADSRADGITINLFDYYGTYYGRTLDDGLNVPPRNFNAGINQNHSLKFSSYGIVGTGINYFTGANQHARTGIVQTTLGDDGYPVLSGGTESLDYLFNTNDIAGAKTTYRDVNHLLTKDPNGTYSYDSNTNYAYYNPNQGDQGDFEVYDGTYNTSNNSSYKIGFFPFTEYDYNQTNIDNTKNQYYNHHFGMTMNASFSLPSDGKLPNGEAMIFDYSGDDDMWLYIDGVLVLDIGGIHEPVHGRINFATGEVTTWPQNNPSNIRRTSLAAIFAEQGITWRNDTNHTFDMFYLERGGQYSNLQLTLNMPITKTVEVNKVVEGELSEDYLDKDFHFQALVDKGDGNGYVPYEGKIEVFGSTSVVNDGKFTLKAKQNAKLLDMKTGWKYKIVELGLDGSLFSSVDISGADTQTVTLSDGVSELSASTGEINTNSGNTIEFNNKLREEKKDIVVEKKWEGDSPSNRPQEIQFRLYQIKNGDVENKTLYRDENGNTVFTLSANNGNWQKIFSQLLTKSGNDTYTYEVEEVSVPTGYVVSYEINQEEDPVNLSITNKRETQLTVQKKWYQQDGTTELTSDLPPSVTVQLYQYRMEEETETITVPAPAEEHTVTFNTTYKSYNQYGSGSNYGGDHTWPGDYTLIERVSGNGGKIRFTVKAFETKFGVLEIKANNGTLTKISETLSNTHSYRPDGESNFRKIVTEATYELSGISSDTTVTIDMIGWLNYPSGSPRSSVSASMDIRNVIVTNGTGGETTETISKIPTPPEEMPEIGTPGLIEYHPEGDGLIQLTAGEDSQWTHTFQNLPLQVIENGKVYYCFYYVKEINGPEGFLTTTESNDGNPSDGAVIKNVLQGFPLTLEKVDAQDNTIKLAGAQFELTSKADGTKITSALSTDDGQILFTKLNPGGYTLKEIRAPEGYYLSDKTWDVTIAGDGAITVKLGDQVLDPANESLIVYQIPNSKIYTLPSAGSIGTYWHSVIGMVFIGTVLLMNITGKRKEEQEKE